MFVMVKSPEIRCECGNDGSDTTTGAGWFKLKTYGCEPDGRGELVHHLSVKCPICHVVHGISLSERDYQASDYHS